MDGNTLGRLANDAGFENLDVMAAMKLFRFGKLVADAEREACANVCESCGALDAMAGEDEGSAAMVRVADRQADLCAAAIRARSNGG